MNQNQLTLTFLAESADSASPSKRKGLKQSASQKSTLTLPPYSKNTGHTSEIMETCEMQLGGHVNVVTGGFPCQPFSSAGLKKRTNDDRYLWPAMLDVIKSRRPDWVLGENVTGIIGVDFCDMLSNLEKADYISQTFIVPACAAGAWHLRNRVWIAAHSKSIGHVSYPVHKGANTEIEIWQPRSLSELLADKELWYEPKPHDKRSANGVPKTLDEMRLRAIGNSIYPPVARVFAKAIRQLI